MGPKVDFDGKKFAQHLVDNVSCATQLDPVKGELANVDDWQLNAEKLFDYAAKSLIARVRELEAALLKCKNLTHRQEQSPETVAAVGRRVAEIVEESNV